MSKTEKTKEVQEINTNQVVNYFYRSTVLNAMFFGYVHSHLSLQTNQSLKSIAMEFMLAFLSDDDDISADQLIRNYYRFIPKWKESNT